MKIVLFDNKEDHFDLLPLSFTRPICDFRVGITTIREKWNSFLPEADIHALPVDFLRERFGQPDDDTEEMLFISGAVVPDADIAARIVSLKSGQAIVCENRPLAFRGSWKTLEQRSFPDVFEEDLRHLRLVYDVFIMNPEVLVEDYKRITAGRKSRPLPDTNHVIGELFDKEGNPMIFLEEGAEVEGAMFNLKDGPVYIGRDAAVMEGCCVRGPIAFCDHSKARMGAKLYGGSTFGPYVKVGGEVDNSVIFGYSNKAHDGYLGNAVVGEWCNIGAGVNCSNLKNDYSKIRLWNYRLHSFARTDLQFCGPIIGDHSKLGVNVMLNTATVIGVGVNIYGAGFPRVFVPSFLEGSANGGFTDVPVKKFLTVAERVMARRNITLTDLDRVIFDRIFDYASHLKK
ncbi:MAG: glucose-1-phosphate thymidylyltransferase [Muribaculaceae bacterium]|nr:glucose-1-phosphate thymidylyltransferase [Muribaculaceae bacterium]